MILITGLMRSCTSPVARMAHQGGIDMGQYMRTPFPGTTHDEEFEDVTMSDFLAGHPTQEEFRGHVATWYEARKRSARTKLWGYKSPFALLYLDGFREICAKRGDELKVICVSRPHKDTVESLEDCAKEAVVASENGLDYSTLINRLSKDQADLQEVLEGADFDLVIPHTEVWKHPDTVVKRIEQVAGIELNMVAALRGVEDRA